MDELNKRARELLRDPNAPGFEVGLLLTSLYLHCLRISREEEERQLEVGD